MNKKINLMPKDEYQKSLARNIIIGVALAGVVSMAPIVKAYFDLNSAKEELKEVSAKVSQISSVTSQIYSLKMQTEEVGNTSKVIETSGFPLNDLFTFLNTYSDKVMFLSLDTQNVLDESADMSVTEGLTDAEGNPIVSPEVPADGTVAPDGTIIPAEGGEEVEPSGTSEKSVNIRGTSIHSEAIADLFYELSRAHFIESSRLVGIEEKILPNGIKQNLFEIAVVVK